MKKYEYMLTEYTLTFNEVLDKMFNSCDTLWFQGEDFQDGTIICLGNGRVQMVYFDKDKSSSPFATPIHLTSSLYYMKYRRVYNQKDAMREG